VKKLFAYLLILSTLPLFGFELVSRSPDGELYVDEVESYEGFNDVMEKLRNRYQAKGELLVDFMAASTPNMVNNTKAAIVRNYNVELTQSEKNDLSFIINTMGMSSLATIAANRGNLKKAGERINHLHPFRFLEGIFTDEQMKVSMHALQNRGWVYGEFFKGLKPSFEEEYAKGNIKKEYIDDFAKRVGIDPKLIYDSIDKQQWMQLVKILIDNVPRNTDTDRYDM
jgi:hypothetical protein